MKQKPVFMLVCWLAICMTMQFASAQDDVASTQRVSIDSNGNPTNDESGDVGLSADGRYVAFWSSATNLVEGDTNGFADIYVRDRQTGVMERVSVSSNGGQSNGISYNPGFSSDGRYVLFSSVATNLVEGDTNDDWDVFVHDRQTGETERVSVSSNGGQSNGQSAPGQYTISEDGRYVGFVSSATNLVADDTNGTWDVFVHDRQTGVTERVSVSSNGGQSDAQSWRASLSGDGRYVAFSSVATNLVADDTNGTWDLFVHDRQTGVTERVSVDSNGTEGNSWSFTRMADMSFDGRYVAFNSASSNLVIGDTNEQVDVFVRDRLTGVTERVNVDSNGTEGNASSYITNIEISGDGRYVAFVSAASNLVIGDTNGKNDVFVHDRLTGETERVSVNSNGNQSDDDNGATYGTDISLSADGRYVGFTSLANNLTADDTTASDLAQGREVFVHDRDNHHPLRPRIVSTSPVDGAVDVATNVLSSGGLGITVAFDKVMNQASVRQSALKLTDLTAGSTPFIFPLGAGAANFLDVSFNSENTAVTVKLLASVTTTTDGYKDFVQLVPGHRYRVELDDSTNAKDVEGNSLLLPFEDRILTFATVGSSGTAVAPSIVSTSPVDDGTVSVDILSTTGVSLTFSALMDRDSVRDTQLELAGGDSWDSFTASPDGDFKTSPQWIYNLDLSSQDVNLAFSDTLTETTVVATLVSGSSVSLLEGRGYRITLNSTSAHRLGNASSKLSYTSRRWCGLEGRFS